MKNTPNNIPENHTLIVLNTIDLSAVPGEIQILPFGWVHSKKGDFLVDAQSIAEMMSELSQHVNDYVVDYEHQTLMNVQAPAAGWIHPSAFHDRGAEGLWAQIEWTAKAQEYLANREYRYFSPVVLMRESDRRAVRFHSGALTNTPAVDGMVPIVNKDGTEVPKEDVTLKEWMKKLILKLGLAENATDEQIGAAVEQLQPADQNEQPVASPEVLQELGLPDNATADQVKEAVKALKAPKPGANNPQYVTKDEMVKALKDELAKEKTGDLVEMALKDGKITPAQQDWAQQYAESDAEGFRKFVLTAPVVVPVGQRIAGNKEPVKDAVIDDTQLMVNKQLGLDDETYKKGVALE